MSIVRAKTNAYGPATLDIQIEQGVAFLLYMTLNFPDEIWDIADAVFSAHMSSQWSPGGNCVDFTVTKSVSVANGLSISLPAAATLTNPFHTLPYPPKKTVNPTPFIMGDWILTVADAANLDAGSIALVTGKVQLLRDPCQT